MILFSLFSITRLVRLVRTGHALAPAPADGSGSLDANKDTLGACPQLQAPSLTDRMILNMVPGWWFQSLLFFHNIWDVILPIDELIFFKIVIAPPTRFWFDHNWLVVWNIFIFPYIGNNHPN